MSRGVHPGALLAAYVLTGVLPLFFIAWQYDADTSVLREIAIAAGLLALALLLLQFVSSGRYETLSRRVGIDRMMRFHQLAARAVLVLALLHPLFFLVPYDSEEVSELPARAVRMFTAPHLSSGVVAWAVLLVLMFMGIWRNRLPLRYELWRGTHTLAAVLAAAGALHHALAIGAYSANIWLAAYWWALGALAFGTLGYLYVVKPFLLVRTAHHVVSNEEIGHGIRELVLGPARGKPLAFEAGQFAWVLLDQPPVTLLDHPFSISSAPEALPEVRLLIKARGDFTSSLHALTPGARAYLDGPHGNFTLSGRSGKTIAMIAGGIGIAPIMGILRHLRARSDVRPIGLVYGARSPRQLVHAAEIRDACATLDLACRFFVDEPPPRWDGGVGELTKAALREAIRGDPAECLCFLCGPTLMMLACRKHLLGCGVPAGRIVFERFDYD